MVDGCSQIGGGKLDGLVKAMVASMGSTVPVCGQSFTIPETAAAPAPPPPLRPRLLFRLLHLRLRPLQRRLTQLQRTGLLRSHHVPTVRDAAGVR